MRLFEGLGIRAGHVHERSGASRETSVPGGQTGPERDGVVHGGVEMTRKAAAERLLIVLDRMEATHHLYLKLGEEALELAKRIDDE